MDPEYLELLICPKTKASLRPATAGELAEVNGRIAAGELAAEAFEAGLTCPSAALIYPIRDDIPVLLVDAALPVQVEQDGAEPSTAPEQA